jgi:hypothetical protein
MPWTEKDLADYLTRKGTPGKTSHVDVSNPPFRALGRLPIGAMNKTESAYDLHLKELHHTGDVLWHKFEAVKLRLADNTFYTCDFAVLVKSCELEMHEVKGFWQDDARVKIKVAASLYPFKFIAVTRRKGGWAREEF